jgi:hypothetical protein
MSRAPKVENNFDRNRFARDLRTIADEVEAGTILVMGLVTSGENGEGGEACFVSDDLTGDVYGLIDEMVNALREVLKRSYEAHE